MTGKANPAGMAGAIKEESETPGNVHIDTEEDLPQLLRLLWQLRALILEAECVQAAYDAEVIAAANLGFVGHNVTSLVTSIADLEERIISIRKIMVEAGGRVSVLRFLSIADRVARQSTQAQSIWHIKPKRYLGAVRSLSTPALDGADYMERSHQQVEA